MNRAKVIREKRYRLRLVQVANKRCRMEAFPTLALPMLAAVTPSNYDIEIIDERVQKHKLHGELPDIVGITFECIRQERAFKVSKHYRDRGVTVIFGGVHTTADPKAVLKHCDAAVVGEAEELWPKILADFEKGKFKGVYKQDTPVDLSKLPPPRMDLINLKRYLPIYPVEATRGCIHHCNFCFSRTINPSYRRFPIARVVEECRKAKGAMIFFMDDNLCADRRNAMKLLRALKPLKKRLAFQSNLYVGKDEELMVAMKEAGANMIFAGLESINPESLKSVDKGFNRVTDYEGCLKNLKSHGIEPKLGLIFGLDDDKKDVFKNMLDFLNKNGVLQVSAKLQIPYPGTAVHMALEQEGRIINLNHEQYNGNHLIVKPKSMTAEELESGYYWFIKNFYSPRRTIWRAMKKMRTPVTAFILLMECVRYHAMHWNDLKKAKKFKP